MHKTLVMLFTVVKLVAGTSESNSAGFLLHAPLTFDVHETEKLLIGGRPRNPADQQTSNAPGATIVGASGGTK